MNSVGSARVLGDLLDPVRLSSLGVDLAAEALTDGTTAFSWRDYADAADRVAEALASVGVVAGDRVGVRVPKSAWSFVIVHGVLRLGAVVVPVDPLAAPDHARSVLADAEIAGLVIDHRLRGSGELVAALGVPIVVPGGSAEWAATQTSARWQGFESPSDPGAAVGGSSPGPAAVDAAPGDDAYIVYTSGSTGRPKGIVHTHESALAYARAAVAQYSLGPSDRAANVAGLHFDQSTFELYAAPLAGAAVVVVPDIALRFPASVARLLHDQATTVWYTVPHVLRQLVDRGGIADLDWSPVRLVKYGGESYPPALLRRLMSVLPAATVSNVYGPAEVNQCTVYDLTEPPSDDATVPIGDAWPAASLLLVDPDDRTVEIDVGIGELLVSSGTMMRGYWKRPELTDARIITRPGDDRRWYVTGDLIERGADGLLRFAGRVDNQVKVRGQRVELEAVDLAIEAAEGVVAGVAVIDRHDPAGDVVAAVVELDPAIRDDDGIGRRLLSEIGASLSAAASPHRLVVVDALPRTSSGKVDRGRAVTLLDQA